MSEKTTFFPPNDGGEQIENLYFQSRNAIMNRAFKEATVARYPSSCHAELKKHLYAFLMAYNFAGRLETLKEKSPYEFVRVVWTVSPERLHSDPNHFNVRLNTWRVREKAGLPDSFRPLHGLRHSFASWRAVPARCKCMNCKSC